MATSERTRDRGRRNARRLLTHVGTELRDARLGAGLSQARVGTVAGLSQSAVSRVELAQAASVGLEELAVHASVLGLRLSIKLYPEGDPVRDAGQLRLLRRLRVQVHHRFGWASEVLVGQQGDLRAWDAWLTGPGTVGIDAETRLYDVQAVQRRCEAKHRDSGAQRIVLLVAATRHNARVLREHREALRSTFPADTAEIMAALRGGQLPVRSGIAVL